MDSKKQGIDCLQQFFIIPVPIFHSPRLNSSFIGNTLHERQGKLTNLVRNPNSHPSLNTWYFCINYRQLNLQHSKYISSTPISSYMLICNLLYIKDCRIRHLEILRCGLRQLPDFAATA